MHRRPAWAALASAGAVLAGAAAAAAPAPGPAPPPCDPGSEPVFALVAPASLPVRYDSGFYLEAVGPGYPAGPYLDSGSDAGPFSVTVAPAGAGALTHA